MSIYLGTGSQNEENECRCKGGKYYSCDLLPVAENIVIVLKKNSLQYKIMFSIHLYNDFPII